MDAEEPPRVTHAGSDILVPEGDYALLDDPARLGRDLDDIMAQAREHGAVAFEVLEDEERQPAIVLHVAATRARLEVHGALRADIFTSPERPFVMLVPGHWADGTIEVPQPGFLVRVDGAWECGTWRLVPAPLPDLRDWAWHWPRAYHDCGILKLGLQRTAEEIAAFVATPLYRQLGPNRLGVAIDDDGQRAMHELTFDHATLWLWRGGWREPQRDAVAFETELLARVLDGELGELWWDLYDTDYGNILATGDDLASLAEYLAPACDAKRIAAHCDRVLRRHVCDATAATTTDEVIAMVERELATHAVAPRRITLRVRDALVGDLQWLRPLHHPRRLLAVEHVT